MKTGAKVGITVGVIIVLLMCCCAGSLAAWYFMAGPGSYQTSKADSSVSAASQKYTKAYKSGQQMESSASGLGSDLSNDTSTASIQNFKDEVAKLESKAQEDIDDLASSDKDLAAAKKLRLPAWYVTYIDTLERRNAAEKAGLESLQKAFSESRKMVGSLEYVIDGVDRMTTGLAVFDEISTAMSASDYAGALAKISEADGSLTAAEAALTTANESIDSQDIKDMIDLSAQFREILPLMTSFIQAAQALDINTMTSIQSELTTKLDAASAAADSVGASGDFATWFEKSITKYEDEFKAKQAEADKLDKEAKNAYSLNSGK